ncbi:MAG: hypothetical protein HY699_25270 [Deltaproteobacteria bacterium]|nr:hypothetical protein [Deltaproteobacteria bacterium]
MKLNGVLLLVAVAAAGTVAPSPGRAGETIEVRIGAVLASNSGQEMDPRLVAMHRQLRSLFPYSSYHLVKEKRQRVATGGKVGFEIPGGRYLLVIPKVLKNERVSMRVMLIEGTRSVVDTALTLRNHGTFLVGGPRHEQGVLIISIGAESALANNPPETGETAPVATQ